MKGSEMPAGRPRKGLSYGRRWAQAHGSQEMLSNELVGLGATFPEHDKLQPVLKSLAREGILVQSRPYDQRSKLYWIADAQVEELLNPEDDSE